MIDLKKKEKKGETCVIHCNVFYFNTASGNTTVLNQGTVKYTRTFLLPELTFFSQNREIFKQSSEDFLAQSAMTTTGQSHLSYGSSFLPLFLRFVA